MLLYVLSITFFLVYIYLKFHFKYWERKGVPSAPYSLLFGSIKDALMLRESIGIAYANIYKYWKTFKYILRILIFVFFLNSKKEV